MNTPQTNVTIRFTGGTSAPPDQRGRILRIWPVGWRRVMVEVTTGVAGANMVFAQVKPNTAWVHMESSTLRPGKFTIARNAWMVPDAGAIDAALAERNKQHEHQQQPDPAA